MSDAIALTPSQATALLWVATLAWAFVSTRGVVVAARLWRLNRAAYRSVRGERSERELVRRRRYSKSRWFLRGFALAALAGWKGIIFLAIFPPPRPDVSLNSATAIVLITVMLTCFERVKHEDMAMLEEARRFEEERRG